MNTTTMDDEQNILYENMNYNSSLKYRNPDQLIINTSKSLKKATKLLLSVSVFSLLLSYSSSLYPIFIHSFKSNSLFPHNLQVLFTHILDKNFTFLICNGILVFLAKTSGLLCSRSGLDHHRKIQKFNLVDIQMDHPGPQTSLEELENYEEAPAGDGWDSTEGSEVEEQEKSQVEDIGLLSSGVGGGAQRDHTNYSFTNDEKIERGSETSFLTFGKDEEEKNPLETCALVSTEELNKRFDEFIRKMRERLRIEAAGQKLIMV